MPAASQAHCSNNAQLRDQKSLQLVGFNKLFAIEKQFQLNLKVLVSPNDEYIRLFLSGV
jgi:hypothetical protein